MILVPVPNDIKKYNPKVIGNYTIRQVACITGAVVLSILEVFFLRKKIEMINLSYLIIFSAVPFFFFGFYKKNGKNFEEWMQIKFKYHFGNQNFPCRITLKGLEVPMISKDTFIPVDFTTSSRFDRISGERIPEWEEEPTQENRLKLWENPIGSFSNLEKEEGPWVGVINEKNFKKEIEKRRSKTLEPEWEVM